MYLSGRERSILGYLLSSSNHKTVKEIAEKFQVSARTIHRELRRLEHSLSHDNVKLVKEVGKGIMVEGSAESIAALKNKVAQITGVELTTEERQSILLHTLIQLNEPVKLYTLSLELDTTIPMITQDLDEIADRIASFGLELIRKRGYGVQVKGEEAQKRAVLSHLISSHIDLFQFIDRIKAKNKEQSETTETIADRLLGLIDPLKLELIEQQVQQMRHQLPYDLADGAYIGLIVHLALAVERLQKGDTIHFDEAYRTEIKNTPEHQVATEMIERLGTAFHMQIPQDEVGYITMHLRGAKLRENQDYLLEDTSLNLAWKARELIEFVNEHMQTQIEGNTQFLNDLTTHLKPAIYRIKQQMNINNPMLADIKRDYLELYTVLKEGLVTIFPELQVPDEEIGYLVLHFAAILLQTEERRHLRVLVICSTGIGTSNMLASKLKIRFPEIDRADHRSFFELDRSTAEGYDLVISTMPLETVDLDYVLISPMLSEEEVVKVKQQIDKLSLRTSRHRHKLKAENGSAFIDNLQSMQRYAETILEILHGFTIYSIPGHDYFLQEVCLITETIGLVTDKQVLFDKLKERERHGGLGIPNSDIALFHTRSEIIQRPSFLIFSLPYSVNVQAMDGSYLAINRILLMLAPTSAHQEALDILSQISGLLIQGQDTLQLFANGSETKIYQYLSRKFQLFMNEKSDI
ncbi:BglG family transcription antiterminator [Gracilibacillus phocaeensis]|uniref:BglG family transcription antiterminator n=1 Tax=Gracilibacillus phocaeensis TaxID=2042304 RepID=UPI0010325AF6|nr:BglG family transcription antiterminator [Gracilibacillus phocaeensis]